MGRPSPPPNGLSTNFDKFPPLETSTTDTMADNDSPVTLRTRKFIRNPLLGRKQMFVDILHPNRANISKEELREKLGGLYKAQKDQISVFGLRTQFRLVRVGLATKAERASRQQQAEEEQAEDPSRY